MFYLLYINTNEIAKPFNFRCERYNLLCYRSNVIFICQLKITRHFHLQLRRYHFSRDVHLIFHWCLYDLFPETASSAENVVLKMTIILMVIRNVMMFSDYSFEDSENEIIKLSLTNDE